MILNYYRLSIVIARVALPIKMNLFLTKERNGRAKTNAYIEGGSEDVGMDIFERGLCLPSDNKMTAEEQDQILKL